MGQIESEDIPKGEKANMLKYKQLPLKRHKRSSSMRINGSLLSARKRSLLQKSWRKTPKTGVENVGTLLFLKLDHIDPTAMRLFGFHLIPKSELKYEKTFQKMAMTFTHAIDYIISNMHDQAKLTEYCRGLGKRHVLFLKRGFRPSYWISFGEALTECAIDWEGGVRCRETLVGWRILVTFIIKEMRSSFMQELRDRSECPVGGDSKSTETAAMFRSLRREMESIE